MFFFEIQEIGRNLSIKKIKLQVDEKNNKNWKIWKKIQMYIINFLTIHYKLKVLGNIIHSIFNYKLKPPVSNLRLPKEQKTRRHQTQEKIWAKKVSKALKSEFFNKNFASFK